VYLLLPQIPMLFMGEEWGASQPFLFFSALGAELADAVRQGRRDEFARFPEFRDASTRERIPDPQSPATFAAAKLSWDELRLPPHAERLEWYRRVLGVRRAEIVPRLAGITHGGAYRVIAEGALLVHWTCADGAVLTLAANLSHRGVTFPHQAGRVLWHEGPPIERDELAAWTVHWSIEEREP